MKTISKIGLGVSAIAIAFALAFAGAASASLSVDKYDLQPYTANNPAYSGFSVTASDGWNIAPDEQACTGLVQVDHLYSGADVPVTFVSQTKHRGWFDPPPGVQVGDRLTNLRATCRVEKTVTRYRWTHEYRWRWHTKHRDGLDTSSRLHAGNCYTDNWFGDLRLDCWGGTYARATYSFSLPSGARQISRHIGSSVHCCDPGTVERYWDGNTAHVGVTNWRALEVRGVSITYKVRKRVRVRESYQVTLHDTQSAQLGNADGDYWYA